MPVLKKFASTVGLTEQHDGEDAAPAKRHLKSTLRKANASALHLGPPQENMASGEAAVRPRSKLSRLFKRSSASSRHNSFEPEDPAIDEADGFEREVQEAAAMRARRPIPSERLAPPPPLRPMSADDGSMISKLGMKVDTDELEAASSRRPASALPRTPLETQGLSRRNATASHRSSLSPLQGSMWSPLSSQGMGDEEGMILDSSSAHRKSAVERDPHREAMVIQEAWARSSTMIARKPVLGLDSEDIATLLDDIPVTEDASPVAEGELPSIRDIDWSKIDEDQMRNLTAAYARNVWAEQYVSPDDLADLLGGYSTSMSSSPHDSAIDIEDEQDEAAYAYIGKGKGRGVTAEQEREELKAVFEQLLKEQEAREAEAERLRKEEEDRQKALELQQQQEEEARLAAERARMRDCNVCGDAKDPLDYPARAPTEKCEHPASTCKECLESWMASEFDTKGPDGIKCPECPETLDYQDVQLAASAETFEAYDKIATRNALASLPEFGWCLAAGCTSGQLNPENNNFMDCASCGYKQCLKHKVPWHANETCEQYEYRTSGAKARDEERKTEEMLDGMSKKCPGPGCGWRIQKTDGCDHMTCRKCRFEFCWQCLASQKEIKSVGNTAHQTWCKFHSHNLDVAWPFNVH